MAVTIIEPKNMDDEKFFEDIRTTALTKYSQNYLESEGIWLNLSKFVGPICDIYVADNRASQMLHFGSQDLADKEVMGYLIQNLDFKKTLYDLVQRNRYINVIDKTNYIKIDNTINGCNVHLDNHTIVKANLVVVCNGYNSQAKRTFFSPQIIKYYGQHALTFIVRHEKPHEGTAIEHFMPSGPFAVLPLKDQYLSSIVWTAKSEHAKALMNLDREELTYLTQKNFGRFLGKVEIEGQIAAFPLKAYQTEQYFNKTIALVADTAHIIHPLAGQGLNQGIKDIETLINLVVMHNEDIILALRIYEKKRKNDNANMLAITDTLNTVFSNNSKIFHNIRQLGFKAINSIPPFKKTLIKYAMGKR